MREERLELEAGEGTEGERAQSKGMTIHTAHHWKLHIISAACNQLQPGILWPGMCLPTGTENALRNTWLKLCDGRSY